MQKTAIWITLNPSKILDGWRLLSHLIPFIFLLLYLPLSASLLLFFTVCYGLLSLLAISYFVRDDATIQHCAYNDGQWHLKDKSGATRQVLLFRKVLFADLFIWCWFIDARGQSYRLHIWPDSASAEARRQLRVLLRLAS